MKPSLFFVCSCGCLLSAAFVFKSESLQGALIMASIALVNVGLLIKVVRS